MSKQDNQGKTIQPAVVLHSRYIKDLSFEHPGAPATISVADPEIDIVFSISGEQRANLYEIVLQIHVKAVYQSRLLFLIELAYAGLFEAIDLDDAHREQFIYTESVRRLFPHADRIIADVVRDGGLPALAITEPDFVELYQKNRKPV